MQFKNDLFKVFSSNVITLIVGIITAFIVPMFLSLDQYAHLRTFTLYLSYVGILHFGFIDGIYIKYGGKLEGELDKKRLLGEHKFLVLFQLIVTILTLALGFILDDAILIAFSVAILPINLQTLFKFLYQAIGEFGVYSKIILITPNLLLIINLIIIFVLKTNNFWPFIIGNIITYYIVFIGLEIYFLKKYIGYSTIIDSRELFSNFKVGIFILIGNLLSMLFYDLDRWFVKFFLSNNDFAIYSFAISMLGVINILINSVTMTFYPYFAREQNEDKLKLIKKYLLIIGSLSSGGYFVFKFVIETFLEKYTPSLDVIMILFVGFPALIIINALYINLYKAKKQEKKYVLSILKMCFISVALNIVALLIYKNNISIAIGTMISIYTWYFFAAKDFPFLKANRKEIFYIGLFCIIYYLSSYYLSWLMGLLMYFTAITILIYSFFKIEVIILIKDILKKNEPIK
jgi:O-antigen/teichoic acid export membrane protein